MTLDGIFVREFKEMSLARKAAMGGLDLYRLELPKGMGGKFSERQTVIIKGISDMYYNRLNGTEAELPGRMQVQRRRFDSNGAYIKGADGKVKLEDVTVPHNCAAVLSGVKLGVPLAYRAKEDFIYSDVVKIENAVRYIYIVPKKYCYKLNMAALVLTQTRLRSYYYGLEITLQCGHMIFVYVTPYKGKNADKGQRVLAVKSGTNFKTELCALLDFWVSINVAYPMNVTALSESINGMTNAAYKETGNTCVDFVKFGSCLENSAVLVGDMA